MPHSSLFKYSWRKMKYRKNICTISFLICAGLTGSSISACFQDLLSPHRGDSDISVLLKLQMLRGSLYWHCCKRATEVNALREGDATSCWPSNVWNLLPSIHPILSPSLHPSKEEIPGNKKRSNGETSAGSIFRAAKSILSPPEQQYEDILWSGATGT